MGTPDSSGSRPGRESLVSGYDFALDRFQIEALDALDRGESVLVAAPTGSGKTVIAEYAIACALAEGRRAFYTAPIKALSNQKFSDLRLVHGPENVGLLTGDNVVNADAPVVVMTTEVLRNMIYARSPALDHLAYVVLDEVHFLQDAYRGPVWEEVITHLDHAVQLVCLSATVSNADEVSEWISTVRGTTSCVVETKRPVRLESLYMVGDRTMGRRHLLPVLERARPNPEAQRLDNEGRRMSRKGGRAHARRKLVTPTRLEVVEMLDEERLLPAIYFIFSRNACDDAAAQCHRAHIVLTDAVERRRIREIAEARLSGLSDHDLDVLGVEQFLAQLENGIAAHHAGMIPPFKETVETCFVEGLVKVVFATETLAVGINMPARSVVIEKLTKFTGEHHTFLTAGEFTQLTGRAGRRGIDTEGHAVVLWNPFITFDQVATLVTSRSFHLNSAFRPTYNMAANLVRTYSAEEAHHLLNLSFAQYQADRDLVRIEARIERRSEHLRRLREDAASPFGDIEDFRAQRQRGAVGHGEERDIDLALAKLRPGDVLYVRKGTYSGPAVVLTVAARKSGMKITVLTRSRLEVTFTAADFDRAPVAIGSIELPQPFAPGRPEFQRETLERLARESLRGRDVAPLDAAHGPQTHPVEEDPDLEHRLSLSVQADREAREIEGLRERVGGRSRSVSRQFDRVLGVLERRGYVSSWVLTERGQILARLFHECDLLVAEALHARLLDGLDAPHLAALVSVFVYEHRSPEPPPEPWFPSGAMRTRFNRISALSQEIRVEEERNGMTPHRAPDPTFVAISYAWASGEGFAEIVDAEDLSGGDFVRTTKQLIDLLRQLALVSPERATRAAAADAADRLFRGVVAASSMVSGLEGEEVEG